MTKPGGDWVPSQTADAFADLIAARVVEAQSDLITRIERLEAKLAAGAAPTYVTAKTLARTLGHHVQWVYDHKHELGAIPCSDGPKPRWKFDLQKACSSYAGRNGTAP